MQLIPEMLKMEIDGRSVREIADKFGISIETVSARLQTMKGMGLLSTEEEPVSSGCPPSKCRSCCGCGGASQGSPVKQYRLTDKGRRMIKKDILS